MEGYFKILKKHLLPNLRWKSMSNGGRDFKLADTFDVYEKSRYFYTGSHLFLHFTTIPNLINILREKKIRLYSLAAMDDKDEFSGSFRKLDTEVGDWQIDEMKKSVFVLSMCEYAVEKEKESLNLWREYGDDGNNVALVFKIKSQLRNNWVHYILSKIYYEQDDLKPFIDTASEIKEYEDAKNFTETHFHIAFYRLFAFHKQSIYKHEREVRLLYSEGFYERDREKAKPDFKNNKNTQYVERELEWEPDEDLLKRIETNREFSDKKKISKIVHNLFPHITIEKILFGYRISNDKKWELIETIRQVMENRGYKKMPTLDYSSLYEYFNDIKRTGEKK